ncbi:MAG TPA: hypothetical protein VNX65_03630, partial [Patescibacteria group bacterium]|nr:hypothetical protein [Patescibacteria group bacterium]
HTLDDIKKLGPDADSAFRLLVLQSHYRSSPNYTQKALENARNSLLELRKFAQLQHQPNLIVEWDKHGTIQKESIDELREELLGLLTDDLRTPQFLAKINQAHSQIRSDKLGSKEAFDALRGLIRFIDQSLGLKLLDEKDLTKEQKDLVALEDTLWKEAKKISGSGESYDFSKIDELKDKLASDYGIIVSNYIGQEGLIWSRYSIPGDS